MKTYDGVYEMKDDEFNEVLKNGIYEYIENNPGRDMIDIMNHFNFGQEKVPSALADLKEENRVKVVWFGLKSCYVVSKCP